MMQMTPRLMQQTYVERVNAAAERHQVRRALQQLRARDDLSRAVFRVMKEDGNVRSLMEEFPALIRQAEARLSGCDARCRTAQP